MHICVQIHERACKTIAARWKDGETINNMSDEK